MLNNPTNQIVANSIYGDFWCDSADAAQIEFGFGADAPNYTFSGSTQLKLMSDDITATYYDTIYNDNGDRIGTIQAFRGYEETKLSYGVFCLELIHLTICIDL